MWHKIKAKMACKSIILPFEVKLEIMSIQAKIGRTKVLCILREFIFLQIFPAMCFIGTIEWVSQDSMSYKGAMHADLMCPTGEG